MVWSDTVIDQSIVAAIGGKRFAFSLKKELPASLSITCSDAELFPLCAVVEVMWAWSPDAFLESVLDRKGQSVEGEISFAFCEEQPDELKPGVTFHHVDRDVVVEYSFLEKFTVKAGYAFIELVGKSGLPKPSSEFSKLLERMNRSGAFSK